MKKLLAVLLKIAISAAILAYLVIRAKGDAAFANLRDQPKDWGTLAGAAVLCAGAVLLTLIRWHFLVRAVGIPCPCRNSLRIGLLGYLFNLAPMGIVGGDLLKAVLLSHEYPGARARSLASVVVDRLIGLYLLFVVASGAILLSGFWRTPVPTIRYVCQVTFWLTATGAVGIAALMVPAVTQGRIAQSLARLRRIGPAVASLLAAIETYRRRPGVLACAALMSVGVHSLFAAGVFLIARGLPGEVHSLGTHFVIMPLAAATGVLPLPLGPFEGALEFLYASVPLAGATIPKGQGLVVALAYRIITVLIAMVGVCYYIGARREVAEVIHEADRSAGGAGPTIALSHESGGSPAAWIGPPSEPAWKG